MKNSFSCATEISLREVHDKIQENHQNAEATYNGNYYILNGQKGNEHSHCFEIVLDIATKDDNPFIKFGAIEDRINEKLNPYQNKLINNIKPFNEINPTIENICEFFKNDFTVF